MIGGRSPREPNTGRRDRRNYYRLLHVQPDAPIEVIRASYRTLMRTLKHHPDLGGDEWNAARINEAYAVLSSADTRRTYDGERVGVDRRSGQVLRVQSALAMPPREELQLAERLVCAFCQTPNRRGRRLTDAECGGCGAPLMMVGFMTSNPTERETSRIEHPSEMCYSVDAARPTSRPGRAVDLSPTGLRFLPAHRLTPGVVRVRPTCQDGRSQAHLQSCCAARRETRTPAMQAGLGTSSMSRRRGVPTENLVLVMYSGHY